MANEGIPGNQRSASLLRQAPQDDVVKPETSTPVIQDTGKVVLAPGHHLPAHLIQLLEEWHQDHPNERPLASVEKRRATDEVRNYRMLSRDRKQCPLFIEITITKPIHYFVHHLPIDDGTQTGLLVKPMSWGSRMCFIKKWLGGNSFQPEPIAVRLTQIEGSFGVFPDESMWQRATEKKLQNELKHKGVERANRSRSSVSRKRSREERDSTSSSGGDIYPEFIRPLTRQQQQRARSVHVKPSDGALRDLGSDEEVEATPVGLSNRGLPIISRSATVGRFTNAQSSRNAASRTSLPHTLHGGAALLTSPLMLNAPSTTTSDSGVDLTTATNTSHPHLNSSGPALITFKLRIPRTRMERHIRIEDNEHNAEELFKEATQYFRRHDRLIGTPILECVIEGEPDCRCIYNAKELRYFIDELRERRGIVKVTVTQSF